MHFKSSHPYCFPPLRCSPTWPQLVGILGAPPADMKLINSKPEEWHTWEAEQCSSSSVHKWEFSLCVLIGPCWIIQQQVRRAPNIWELSMGWTSLLHWHGAAGRCRCNSACMCVFLRRGRGGGGGEGTAWVKWTVTTIWFAFSWSRCFPYFPFVCSSGAPACKEWCDGTQNTLFSITSTIITVINSSSISN